jgi:hypothetical protein
MGAPINVKLQKPTIAIPDWQEQAQNWTTLNAEVGGHPDFYPLTVKFAYLVGVIHDICECVARLLNDKDFAKRTSYIPAYALFASGIEILGRCVKGESKPQKSTLKAGFQWLADPRFPEYSQIGKSTVLISTTQRKYTVNELEQLRNFAAHGQATSTFYKVDYEILSQLRPLLRDGLEHYWARLQRNEDPCNNLALAAIVPLGGWPVLNTWLLLQGNPRDGNQSLTDLFDKFDQAFRI